MKLFVVRVWRPQAGGFRANVRAVEQESACTFHTPEELARYLDAAVRSVEALVTPPDGAAAPSRCPPDAGA